MNAILNGVCLEFGIEPGDLLDSRTRGVVTRARRAAILLLRADNSVRETARILNINTSAVMYHLERKPRT